MTGDFLAGKSALVTGAASGIGAACARALSGVGAKVIVADVNGPAATAVAGEIGGEAWQVDLSNTTALSHLTLEVDVLINNAGIQYVSPIEEFPLEKFQLILALMLEAPFLLIKAALPHMRARKYGRIINISSVHGLRASPYKSAYVAAKHGLEGLSKVVALECAADRVTSNCVCPGYVRTPLVEKQISDQARIHGLMEEEVVNQVLLAETAVKRLVEPAEVASLVLWLAGPSADMATGGPIYSMGAGVRSDRSELIICGDFQPVIHIVGM